MPKPPKNKKANVAANTDIEETDRIPPQNRDVPAQSEALRHQMQEYDPKSPILSGDDVDAAKNDAEQSGEESVGGTVATPDHDVVEENGRTVGITYNDDEPLNTEDKLRKRDLHRWELNPASAEEEEPPVTDDELEETLDLDGEPVDEDEL